VHHDFRSPRHHRLGAAAMGPSDGSPQQS
jgi:hypothetical protein